MARRLTMEEAAVVLGWAEGNNAARNTRDRLRRVQRALGVRVLWGAGRQGVRAWTTFSALRDAGLVDDMRLTLGEVGEQVREYLARLSAVEKCIRLLAAEVAKLTRVVGADSSRFSAENMEKVLPSSPLTGARRLPGRPKGSKDRAPRKSRKRRKKP